MTQITTHHVHWPGNSEDPRESHEPLVLQPRTLHKQTNKQTSTQFQSESSDTKTWLQKIIMKHSESYLIEILHHFAHDIKISALEHLSCDQPW